MTNISQRTLWVQEGAIFDYQTVMTDMIDRELMIIEIHITWKSKGKYILHIIQSTLFDEDPIQ